MIGVEVSLHGDFLTGDPLPVIDEFITDGTEILAAQGMATWHRLLDISIRNPTPYYETRLMSERMSPERVDLHDQGMIYGPWLEGIESRNATTQFKGYASLRRAAQMVERQAVVRVQPAVELMIRRLGG